MMVFQINNILVQITNSWVPFIYCVLKEIVYCLELGNLNKRSKKPLKCTMITLISQLRQQALRLFHFSFAATDGEPQDLSKLLLLLIFHQQVLIILKDIESLDCNTFYINKWESIISLVINCSLFEVKRSIFWGMWSSLGFRSRLCGIGWSS